MKNFLWKNNAFQIPRIDAANYARPATPTSGFAYAYIGGRFCTWQNYSYSVKNIYHLTIAIWIAI